MESLESSLESLKGQLPRDEIKNLKGIDYVSGHYVIGTANKIFGPDGWKHEILSQKVVSDRVVTREGGERLSAVVSCIVRVHAIGTYHDGSGVGLGEAGINNAGAAYELAFKASETDAMKRALKNFGDVLGLALYEKVEKGGEREGVGASTAAQDLLGSLQSVAMKTDVIEDWYDANKAAINKLPPADVKPIHTAYDAKLDAAIEAGHAYQIDNARNLGELDQAFADAERAKLDQLTMRRLTARATARKAALQSVAANDRGRGRDDERSDADDSDFERDRGRGTNVGHSRG